MSMAKYDAWKKLTQEAARLERQANDVLAYPDPDHIERLDYLINQVMDSAHAILDYAHEFKQQALLELTERN